jgi:two-component system, sensor histidine kinase LadS
VLIVVGLFVAFLMKTHTILILVLLLAGGLVQAQPQIVLNQNQIRFDIGRQIAILEDPTRQLTLADVQLEKYKHRFWQSRDKVPNLGISASAFWIRCQILTTDSTRTWLLEDYFRHVAMFDFYLTDTAGTLLDQYRAGDWRGPANRPLPTYNYVFPLHIRPGQPATVYLRIENRTGKIFPLQIWESTAFWQEAQQQSLLIGLYFSAVGVIMLIFFVLYLYNPNRGYLFFCLFLLFFLLSELIRGNGNFFIRYVGAYYPFWSRHIIELYNTLVVLGAAFNLYFYSESLLVRHRQPVLHRWLMAGWIVHALLLPVIWLEVVPVIFSMTAFFISPLLGYFANSVVSVIRWRQGFQSAIYYLVGSGFYFCGILLTLFSYAGVLEVNGMLFQNLLNLSSVLEIICLSLGFADSIRRERRAYVEQLETANAELIQRNKDIEVSLLQGQVLERKRVGRELHDGLGGMLFGIRAMLFGFRPEKLTADQQQTYQTISELLMRTEQELKLIAYNQFPAALEEYGLLAALDAYIQELNGLHDTQFRLETNPQTDRLTLKTEFELFSIVRELATNILKHAQATEAIIQLYQTQNEVQLTVTDNGLGFDKAKPTAGMGMKNLRQRSRELGGRVVVDTGNHGTRVVIHLMKSIPYEWLS